MHSYSFYYLFSSLSCLQIALRLHLNVQWCQFSHGTAQNMAENQLIFSALCTVYRAGMSAALT